MPTLIAEFTSRCETCGEVIETGDEMVYSRGESSHVKCPANIETPVHGFCSSCFLALPATGICTNCD